MGMRGKKKKHLTAEQKKAVMEFRQWVQSEIEKDFIDKLKNYDHAYDVLNGFGASTIKSPISL